MMTHLQLFSKVLLVFLCMSECGCSTQCNVAIQHDFVKNKVEEFFISFCIDSFMFDPSVRWHGFDFSSQKLHTLMRSMTPSILRIGGGPADFLFFDIPQDALNSSGVKPDPIVMTKLDLVNLITLTRATHSRLLLDFNAQVRYGYQWDPSNAIQILEFCKQNGYGENIDFELGNEPDYLLPELITPTLLGRDFKILNKIVKHYSTFNSSVIVGPDIISISPLALDYLSSVINDSGDFLRAATFHHYYFRGDVANYTEYLKTNYFGDLETHINVIKNKISKTKYPKIDLWIGETSDAWHSGTPNVSNRFVSAFLWLDKLGLSALMGVKVVMRQTLFGFDYALLDHNLDPNPDFWLSWLHKSFVGRQVFQTKPVCTNKGSETCRIYAHCTKPSPLYKPGSLTLFALNINPKEVALLTFTGILKGEAYHIYLVEAGNEAEVPVLSRFCKVNGKLMKMPSDWSMPDVIPQEQDPSFPFKLPPLTYAFLVFHKVNIKACQDESHEDLFPIFMSKIQNTDRRKSFTETF